MKTRALYLALINDIFSVEEFARLVGIDIDQATKLFYEHPGVTMDTLDKCCLYFNVSLKYFTCEVE